MPNKIKPKRSYTANSVPVVSGSTPDIERSELAINWADGIAYTRNNSDQLVSITLGGGGGGGSVTIPASGDQYFDDTLLLMRMNLSAGDLSLYRVALTTPPGVFSTTAKFGTHSYNVNRQTGFTSTSKSIPNISTGNWTVEAWVYRQTADDTYAAIVFLNAGSVASSAGTGGLNIYINQDGSVVQNNGLAGSLNGGSVPVGAWTHVAVVMNSGVSKLYVNGISVSTGSQQPVAGPYWANIGWVQSDSPTFASDLLIDDLRVTRAARYTANFTPPTATHSIAPYIAAQTIASGGSGLSWSSVPASATATGTAGEIAYDGSSFYLASATNTWVRSRMKTWIDQYFNSVALLMHMEGANASTTFTDSSGNAFAVTKNGNAQISTAQYKYGTASAYFDGSSNTYLNLGGQSVFAFGTGDWAIEFWIRPTTISSVNQLFHFAGEGEGALPRIDVALVSGQLVFYILGAIRIQGSTTLSTNTWYHVAVARSSGATRIWLDGSQQGSSYSDSNNYGVGASRPLIGWNGQNVSATEGFIGYMDDIRMTSGSARGYSGSTITVPTTPFSDL
jgi:Concanavalin A-like lectin/glucanases superfamily